eukprot:CAMPEP_0198715034 /NCGR_PEP_ID=MMETSP1471-20131121/26727_1 /TAXON_ID=41880 /ORGANISM="Pycnococcus provasolii, Strain RCC733" /LENGTH=79 /DNA_ID=CAMNT_0044475405 /DNA_START=74 /DNA_END=309 /DNA_ORIENTATION=+
MALAPTSIAVAVALFAASWYDGSMACTSHVTVFFFSSSEPDLSPPIKLALTRGEPLTLQSSASLQRASVFGRSIVYIAT